MIEIRFNRQTLSMAEKKIYAGALKSIITKIILFNKGAKLFKEVADVEIRIIFK